MALFEQELPLPGAFAFPAPAAWYVHPSDGNPYHGGNVPMTIPMELVEDRILSIRGHRVMLDEAAAADRVLIVACPPVPWHPVDKEVRR